MSGPIGGEGAEPAPADGPARDIRFAATARSGEVSARLLQPDDARWLLVLAHGAGAGMRHPFLESIARRLGERGIATFRYQFPYTEQGRRRPDPQPVLTATVRSAVAAAERAAGSLPMLAGGKSMGGRMTSLAAADGGLSQVRGLVFVGFPLHPPGKPSADRADHLDRVPLPMLFLQGTRDSLADLDLLRPVCRRLADRATLHVIDGADHSFRLPRGSGRPDAEPLDELADTVAAWATRLG